MFFKSRQAYVMMQKCQNVLTCWKGLIYKVSVPLGQCPVNCPTWSIKHDGKIIGCNHQVMQYLVIVDLWQHDPSPDTNV